LATSKTVYAPASVQPHVKQSAPVTSFVFDILRGAVLGDWAHNLRIPGAVIQAIMGFIPVVGDICAIRDGIHDLVYRDVVGVTLNILALVPIFGGIPKTIEVIRSVRHVSHAYSRQRHQRHQRHQRRSA
jgi:hypothetical protein